MGVFFDLLNMTSLSMLSIFSCDACFLSYELGNNPKKLAQFLIFRPKNQTLPPKLTCRSDVMFDLKDSLMFYIIKPISVSRSLD